MSGKIDMELYVNYLFLILVHGHRKILAVFRPKMINKKS